ncbi:hypothetical protein [Hymenobacter negativus]|uniref:Uncharacterized protein n=1 Tax=Hymenobacter negativus TaxID=2795026 RepID=A0ABS0Q3I1_9BACT|nr:MULTISPECIES: hypothetical protein [Bacteria]MBH8557211.1 hypothetical protein [Hymenobacter negativus]MBH8569503.1 hypothetical protein [Hymenobacter negativus]MBR7209239.1 hypothetical protein [Microvirga sp. STS02]
MFVKLTDVIFTQKTNPLLSSVPFTHLSRATFMQHRDQDAGAGVINPLCCAHCEEDLEQLVVFELIVPKAAKVALPRLQPEIGPLTLRENSVTTTVPGKLYMQLQASNTATRAGWYMTATLAAAPASFPECRR